MQIGNWQIDPVNGGYFRLDGGVMFGVVPKSLWKEVAPVDDNNRILIGNHCFLARDGRQTVLIDTGYGGKYSPLDRKFYEMQAGDPLLDSLATLGVQPSEIDSVIFSHLHFDHVGGATCFDERRQRQLVFPNATHYVGTTEWSDAISESVEVKTAYTADEIAPLKSARLELLPDDSGKANVLPGIRVVRSGGHTRGHLSIYFESMNQSAVFLGDICPSTAHLRRMWHTAYDTFPLETRRRKPELLTEAAQRGTWVLWNHDPNTAVSRIEVDPKREFRVVDQVKPPYHPGAGIRTAPN